MARVLGIGNATLDIVNVVESYPPEDAEVRAAHHYRTRGGNAANTLVTLAQLGHGCAWAGTLPDGPDAEFIRNDLQRHGIDIGPTETINGGTAPTSYIILSKATGSRTIVHHRDLPELSTSAFLRLDLSSYDWLHFEGRNVERIGRMMEYTAHRHPAIPLSLEVEKPRPGIESLFGYARLLLFSRAYAAACGYDDPRRLLDGIAQAAPDAQLVCAWGEEGAAGRDRDGRHWQAAACPPDEVRDTIGAGDVFNGAMIDALISGLALPEALNAGCRLAGRKCGMYGMDGLTASPRPRR